jgi:hypothetical protein
VFAAIEKLAAVGSSDSVVGSDGKLSREGL